MLEDVTVVDELADLRERNIDDHRLRRALAAPPLLDAADAALGVHDLRNIRRRDAQRDIVLQHASADAPVQGHRQRCVLARLAVDGSERAFRLRTTPMRDNGHRLLGAVTILEDITHLREI